MLLKCIYLIIEIIVTLIGVLFMLPLTLWRIPTFIKLYRYHNDKKLFFNLLKKMYKQLFIDIILLPLKLIVIIVAPVSYYKYVKDTSFNYGP
jgi:hypothetical protein